jgi:hypothetical protein
VSSAAVIFAAVPTLFSSGGEIDLEANRALHALSLRGLGGTTARMTVDPPDAELAAATAVDVAALLRSPRLLPAGCYRRAVNQGPR